MNKVLKLVVTIAVVAVVLIVGLTVLVKSYLTDARVRSLIIETAESSLERKVSIGAISVSIFSGISAKDFEVREKDSDSDFLKADAFVIKYEILPLLSRRLVIDRLAIESPKIVIRKNPDGSFNFSDMIGKKRGPVPGKKAEPSGLFVTPSVQSFRIEGGRLEYYDATGRVKKALISLDADMSIEGRSAEAFRSHGKVQIKFLELALKDRPGAVTDIPVSLQYRGEVNFAKKRLEIDEASVTGPGVPATIKGAVNYGEPLSYAGEVDARSVKLDEMQKALSAFLPPGMGLSGTMSVKIAAQRKAEDAKTALNGEIGFEKVGVRMEKMAPVFSGTLVLTPEQITLKSMKLLAGKSSADIRGGIANYSANPDIHLDVASDMLDLDSIMPPAVKGGAASAPAVAATGAEGEKAKESGTPKKKVTAEGSVSVSRMLFRGVTMRNLKAEYTFRDNVFSLSPLTGETLSGSFSLRSAVDLSKKDPSFRLNATAAGIKLEDIAAAFAPKAKGILFGSLSARTDIGGTGSSAEAVKHSMKGKGLFSVKDGRIRNAPVSDGLLAVLGLQSLKEIPVEKGQGTFSISRGVIDLKSIIASKDLVIDESGTIGMDQTLNMSVLVKVSDRLSPKLLAQSGISKFLSEEKGWTAVPLRLTGSVTRPSYGVDTSAIGRRATKAIQKRVGDEIFKALSGEKKKEQQPSTTEKKGTSPEDLIKGLFK